MRVAQAQPSPVWFTAEEFLKWGLQAYFDVRRNLDPSEPNESPDTFTAEVFRAVADRVVSAGSSRGVSIDLGINGGGSISGHGC